MSIEENIFKRAEIDLTKLEKYGFKKSGTNYIFTQKFMENSYQAEIIVNEKCQLSGKVYDLDTQDEYIPLRVESMNVGYTGNIRKEYEKILENIKANCCNENYFVQPQTNRISQYMTTQFGDNPVFPWEKYTRHGVFKNPRNNKWYALIMTIDKSKLDKKQSGEIEIINLKIDKEKIKELLKYKGYYPAYHMNKQNWITITLDDTIYDDKLISLINESHGYTSGLH